MEQRQRAKPEAEMYASDDVYLRARQHGYNNEIAARIAYNIRCVGTGWDQAVARAFLKSRESA